MRTEYEYVKVKIDNTQGDNKCMLCGDKNETSFTPIKN